MDENNRNFIIAIVLSMVILLGWQLFYGLPKMQKEQAQKEAERQTKVTRQQVPHTDAATRPGSLSPDGVRTPAVPVTVPASREEVIKRTRRVAIHSTALDGSINLTGARIDDLKLTRYRETVDPKSPPVTLFSPAGTPRPYFADFGFRASTGQKLKLPDSRTGWQQQGSGALTPTSPVVLTWDNGAGLKFKRTISLDDNYLFTIRDEVINTTNKEITLYPYGLVRRQDKPHTQSLYILHEGFVGVLGKDGLIEISYSDALDEKSKPFTDTGGWLGITDKYWAATLIPEQNAPYNAGFEAWKSSGHEFYQAQFLLTAGLKIPAGQSATTTARLFAGAKQSALLNEIENKYKIEKFSLLIDWGWFKFITKPLFQLLSFFYHLVGNFGVAILIVTVLVKAAFFPLANKSYNSMSKMKLVQPQMQKLRERYKDDPAKMQQELMKLYKTEGINPMAGCLPILIQIPVFFALYKVLYITIDMRHAPFFGWIQDLSAPDPTSIINLFGLLPFEAPAWFGIGIWPVLMGITMWVQMRLNPQQADPLQQKIFNWMPVLFTFMLGSFASGLVIYWTWNNLLSIIQQWTIMKRNGVEVDLLENTGLRQLVKRVSGLVGKKG